MSHGSAKRLRFHQQMVTVTPRRTPRSFSSRVPFVSKTFNRPFLSWSGTEHSACFEPPPPQKKLSPSLRDVTFS